MGGQVTLLPRGMVPPVPPLPYMEWGEVPADHPGRSDLAAFGIMVCAPGSLIHRRSVNMASPSAP